MYIRYFAVQNGNGENLGTMEVAQDIKPVQKITGEKRIAYDELIILYHLLKYHGDVRVGNGNLQAL